MNDLMNRLAALGDSAPATASEGAVADDVRRGRGALRRRRTVGLASAGVLALAVAGTGTAVALQGHSAPAGVQLVDYAGAQPAGFTVATVPDGFVVQRDDTDGLVMARQGDTTSDDVFTDKIFVSAQRKLDAGVGTTTPITVDGRAGVSWDEVDGPDGDGATTLEYPDSDGHVVRLQAWDSLGLTTDQLLQLATGITITAMPPKPVASTSAPKPHYALYRTPQGKLVRIPLKAGEHPHVFRYRNAQGKQITIHLGTRVGLRNTKH